jgi:hypothetical protein
MIVGKKKSAANPLKKRMKTRRCRSTEWARVRGDVEEGKRSEVRGKR